ncbi:MAG: hypothetical protein HXP23_07825, partial [Veillonella sp.]|nr:hypothetical protein [Veillonella sp.]
NPSASPFVAVFTAVGIAAKQSLTTMKIQVIFQRINNNMNNKTSLL